MISYSNFFDGISHAPDGASPSRAESTFLDVGHGMCVVIEIEDDTVVVVDCAHAGTLAQFLRSKGKTRINALLVSHLDRDHYEGVTALLDSRSFDIDRIYINPETAAVEEDPGRYERKLLDRFWRALWSRVVIDQLSALHLAPSGLALDLAQGYCMTVLWPDAIATIAPGKLIREMIGVADQNALSLVCLLTASGRPEILFTSDTNGRVLSLIGQRGVDLRAPVLQLPHHGGNIGQGASGSSPKAVALKLASAVRPFVAIAQNGRGRYDNPHQQILAGIRDVNPATYIACSQLNMNCSNCTDHMTPKCAGNVRVLHELAVVTFERNDHQTFAKGLRAASGGPSARCQ